MHEAYVAGPTKEVFGSVVGLQQIVNSEIEKGKVQLLKCGDVLK
jgi:hypothetical protein